MPGPARPAQEAQAAEHCGVLGQGAAGRRGVCPQSLAALCGILEGPRLVDGPALPPSSGSDPFQAGPQCSRTRERQARSQCSRDSLLDFRSLRSWSLRAGAGVPAGRGGCSPLVRFELAI